MAGLPQFPNRTHYSQLGFETPHSPPGLRPFRPQLATTRQPKGHDAPLVTSAFLPEKPWERGWCSHHLSALCLPNLLLELADVCSRNIRLRQFPVLVFWCYLLLNWAYCYRRFWVLRTDFCGSQKFRKYCDCNRRFVPLSLLLKEGSWSYQVICFHKHMFNLF